MLGLDAAEEIAALQHQITVLTQMNQQQGLVIVQQNQEIAQKNQIIATQTTTIQGQDVLIGALQQQIAQKDQIIATQTLTIQQKDALIAQKDTQIATLQQSNSQLSLQLQLANAAIESKDQQIATLNQQNAAFKNSNNHAPAQWGYGAYDQGAHPSAPFVQNMLNILNGFSNIHLNPVYAYVPLALPTFTIVAQGMAVNFPANWTSSTIVFELEFGHTTTAYTNYQDIAREMYRLFPVGMSANVTAYPYFYEGLPSGAVGGGGETPLHLRALHRLAFQYTPVAIPSSVTISIEFNDGGNGDAHAQYASFSCVFKQYTDTAWSVIP